MKTSTLTDFMPQLQITKNREYFKFYTLRPNFISSSNQLGSMSSPKERGTLLDTWMFILLVANIGAVIWYFGGYLVTAASPNGTGFLLNEVALVFLVCSPLIWNIICLRFLYKWKKWGFFGFFGGVFFVLGWNLYFGQGVFAFLGLIGVAILGLGLRSKWKLFD